jgi:2-polyprenyl-3-methyl-5-hydroxy-6-metoxy-1,4-benzoquinol methylase
MKEGFSAQELERIEAGIRKKYTAVAESPGGHFSYPTGREGLEKLKYDRRFLLRLPDNVAASYCGVGNALSLGEVKPGERVLDVGCGAGVDALLAAERVGDAGSVLAIDVTMEMIERAKANQAEMGAYNIEFKQADVTQLCGLDATFDLVVSNGVFNLIADKDKAIRAVFRWLKPGGRLWMADQFLVRAAAKSIEERVASWFR